MSGNEASSSVPNLGYPCFRGWCMQGKYKVTPGANPGSHMWLLCNPGIPRTTPFVVDLGGSELIFQV